MSSTGPSNTIFDPALRRYSRQMLFAPIGEAGQRKLAASRVTLIGCGALGSVQAEILVRAGVGHVRICDRDFVEWANLHRQALCDEDDIEAGLPKAEAARRKLIRINSQVEVESVVTDVNPANIERLTEDADLILDGTDNFETRYLINDAAVKHGTPWVHGAAIADTGLCMAVLPGETPCLRCVFEDAPPLEMSPTCDTVGVLGPLIHMVAGSQASEAIKILIGHRDAVNRNLVSLDAWTGRFTDIAVADARERGNCICCKQRQFEYLDGDRISLTTNPCGRDAIQVNRKGGRTIVLPALAKRLRPVASEVRANVHLVKATVGDYELIVFVDGRAIVKGTDDPDVAKAIYAKHVPT
ncbi:MAG: ThiF family adenylyltransferase [Phycisphaerales bacterium]|nr:MAG: ThiF family adenylyltransferase [Phycisphaerales bacterium]